MSKEKKFILKNGLIYRDGKVRVEDLALSQGLIAAVGSNLDDALFGAWERIDLHQALVLPAFTDSHVHLVGIANSFFTVNLKNARSLAEALKEIQNFQLKLDPGNWVCGGRWDKNLWENPAFPNKESLDQVTGDHPAMLWSKDGHSLWLNSLGLKELGISRHTPDPPGGKILHDERGEPTGILLEKAANLYAQKLSSSLGELEKRGLLQASKYLNALGIVACNHFFAEKADIMLETLREMRLPLRITLWPEVSQLQDLISLRWCSGEGNEWIRLGGVKIFADGALGSQTAYMLEPYSGYETARGIATLSEEELSDSIQQAIGAGISVAVHAIGDGAVRMAIHALLPYKEKNPVLRNRIEHAQILAWEDLIPLKDSGLLLSVQPIHATSDKEMALRLWGKERCHRAYAYNSYDRNGIPLCFGSDAPVEDPCPIKGIYAATTRLTPFEEGLPFFPEEAISLEKAVTAYTTGGAFSTFSESFRGDLLPGKKADLVILSQNLFELPLSSLKNIRVLLTFLEGEIVYQAAFSGITI